jgi:iron complex transport system substrate-binding protein
MTGQRAKGLGLIVVAIALSLQPSALLGEARRVISIIPATTEMLFAMGAGDRVIAIGSYDRYPPESQKLPRVGALIDPNVEQILQMHPDLVVLYGTQAELKRRLERANIQYYSYVHKGLADITQTIRTLGMRVGADAAGNALASRIERQLDEIRRRVAAQERPKTLLVFGREPGSLRNIDASGGEGFLHDMLEAAGGADVLADIHRQSVMMTTEMVLARAPDVIIELRYLNDIDSAALSPWNRLSAVPAVKNHRVLLLTGEEFVVPGPRVAQAVQKMAAALHPELRW